MSNETNVRYLVDRDGERYVPITHSQYVIGLNEITSELKSEIDKLKEEQAKIQEEIKLSKKQEEVD
ncbi:hypothetical protein QI230_02755 [Staphylococcus saprophyticus]|nr:hypothetical protein [Staphylococcus saprophyticus]